MYYNKREDRESRKMGEGCKKLKIGKNTVYPSNVRDQLIKSTRDLRHAPEIRQHFFSTHIFYF